MKKDQFIKLYKTNPCRFHASALWKTLTREGVIIDSTEDTIGIKTIKIYNNTTLFLYWDRENDEPKDIDMFETYLFHVKQLDGADEIKECAERYFRLKYCGNKPYIKNEKYIIKKVRIENEAHLVSEFISKCYKDLHPAKEDVLSWTKHPVYKGDLWIWIIEPITGEKLGLGIAEYDANIKEGSLEWIQVLPIHGSKGIGKSIVKELVNRMDCADFITVSGKADNSAAEKLYRSCGFEGDDFWYVIKE